MEDETILSGGDDQTIASGGSSSSATRRSGPRLPSAGPVIRTIGDYDLISEIARGGMGVVYRARQVSLNRPVAFKMIVSGQLATAADVERFHVEAEAAASLEHPNIVPIYEVGESEGNHFFSMKLVEGGSLAGALPRLKAHPRDAVRMVAKVCRAIHYAHQHGILHRDLKPANILLDSTQEPHVTDFGLAKRTEGDSGLTQTGAIVGTPSYMAPEQASPSARIAVTTSADVYSLGAILYEMLTGRPPFKGASALDTLMLVINQEPDRPSTIAAGADKDLETIALKCLEKDPARRYGSAEALAADLDRWLAHEPISARPITTTERVVKWARRRPAIAALAAAIGIVAVAGVAGIAWQWRVAVAARLDANNKAAAESRARADAVTAMNNERTAHQQEAEQRKLADAARQQAVEQTSIAQRALASAETNLYFNNLDLADRELRAGNFRRADELVAESPAALRNWEWHHLDRLLHLETAVIPTRGAPIRAIAFSRDGAHFVTANSDLTVTTWDSKTHREVATMPLEGAGGNVATVMVISQDATMLAAVFGPGGRSSMLPGASVWDAATGRRRFTLPVGHLANAIALSPDGARLATVAVDLDAVVASRGSQEFTLSQWDLGTGRALGWPGETPAGIHDVEFSPDGARLALMGAETKVVDAASGRTLATLSHADNVWKLQFSPDGAVIAAAIRGEGVRAWSAKDGRELWSSPRLTDPVLRVAFSPDGRQVAAAIADRTMRVFDGVTGHERSMITGKVTVTALAFTPDGANLASAGAGIDNFIRLWEPRAAPPAIVVTGITAPSPESGQSGRSGASLPTAEATQSVRLDPSRQSVLAIIAKPNGPTRIAGWDVRTGERRFEATLSEFDPTPRGVPPMFTQDGRRVIVAKPLMTANANGSAVVRSMATVIDASTGRELIALKPRGSVGSTEVSDRTVLSRSSRVDTILALEMALSPAGDRAALAGQLMTALSAPPRGASAAAFLDSLPTLVGSVVDVWDVNTGRSLVELQLLGRRVTRIRFAPDGKIVAIATSAVDPSGPQDVTIYETVTGRRLRTLPDVLSPLTFSADGRVLAAATLQNGVTLWDPVTGTRLATLPDHGAALNTLGFSPDGTRLATLAGATLTQDGIIKIWDVATGRQGLVLGTCAGACTAQEILVTGKTTMTTSLLVIGLSFSADGRQLTETYSVPDPKGVKIQLKTWDATPRLNR